MKKIAMVLGLLLISISIHTMEQAEKEKSNLDIVTIRYVDKESETKIKIPKKFLPLSTTLNHQIEDGAEECYVSSNEIDVDTLYHIQDLLPHIYDLIPKNYKSRLYIDPKENKRILKEKLEKKSDKNLVALANGADYLAIDPLIQQITQYLSQRILALKKLYKKMYEQNICQLNKLNPVIAHQILKMITEQPVKTLKGHTDAVQSINFSTDGTKIVSGSKDGTIKIWDAQTGALLKTLRSYISDSGVKSANFSPDGTRIVASYQNKTIKIWNIETGHVVYESKHSCPVSSVNFSPDGNKIVAGTLCDAFVPYGTIEIWNVWQQYQHILTESDSFHSVNFSPDGAKIIAGSHYGEVQIWDPLINNYHKLIHSPTNSSVIAVNFSSDGKKIISGSYDTIKIWDAQTRQCMHTLTDHTYSIQSVNFSPDSTQIVVGYWDKTIKIWDIQTGTCLHNLTGHSGPVFSVNFSPDGTKIVSSSKDMTIKVWFISQSIAEYLQFMDA